MLHHKHVRHTWYAANLAAFAFAIFGSLYAFFAAYADAPVVQGTVTKQDGSGVPNVTVELHTPDGLFTVNTTTDVSGNYTLVTTLVHNTNYVVETRALDGYNRNEPHQQNFLYQTGDGVRIYNFGLTQATKTITGHVQDENGVAITDADINVTPYNITGASSSAARTDASGNFSTTVLGGTWFAQAAVNLSEYTPQWIAEQPPVRIDFANDATVESQTVNFTVTRATGQVSVRLLNSDNTNLTSSNFVADIDIRRADGAGTVRKVRQSDSVVSVFLTPGIYSMCAFHPDLNGKSFDPVATTFVMTENGNVDLGTVSAQVNTAHLKGKVVDSKGVGLGNVQIQAIRDNGCDRPTGASAPDGTFDLTVGPGTWTIGLNSANPQHSQLAPASATVTNGQTVTGLNVTLKTIDKTISGRVLNLAGQPITDYVGMAFVTTTSRKGKVTAPVVAGQFSIRYSSSDIAGSKVIVGVESSDGSDFTGSRGAQVSISGPSAAKDITVRPYDATLNGTLLYPNGTAVTGFTTTIDIVAVDADGNFTSTSVNPVSGAYSLPLAAGTWFYDYEIDDPDGTANLMNKSAGKNTVTVKAGQTVVKNVTVAQGRNTVTGTVTDADGLAVRAARVTLDNRATLENSGAANADSLVELTTETDVNGVYSAVVPDGTFMVTVGETPSVGESQLPPDGKVVTVSGATSKVVNLTFERTNATIKGKVTYKNKAEG
ncbi:MAG: carboxypeptidase regulatory-like domain-containing protein, partial [Candidatus Kerfeldbacteria bacterium]|nr:carboxypeptidase regulatory-like domain-containing protein [Candidatus Kerfeldbacteria bacterium]